MNAASPANILRAVERWADIVDGGVASKRPLHCTSDGDVRIYEESGDPIGRLASPALALAWALLVETDAGPVDVGRCPACVARSGKRGGRLALATMEWRVDGMSLPVRAIDGWPGFEPVSYPSRPWSVWMVHRWRPCPECSATTRAAAPVARMLLDAVGGDAEALARLLEHADQLQAAGDPIGELLGWALTLWTGEPTDCVCPSCDGNPPTYGSGASRKRRCDTCDQTGQLRGHPHTADAVRWLDRLIDAREDAAEEADEARRLDKAFAREAERLQRQGTRF